MDIKNKVVFISGGASGLGLATAIHLQNQGAKIYICDVNKYVLDEVKEKYSFAGNICDVRDEAQAENTVQDCETTLGNIQICVNCAGVAPAKKILSKKGVMPLESFQNAININLVGTFNIMKFCAASMSNAIPDSETAEKGVIINTASIAAFEGQVGQTAYSASKGGVVAMTLPAARELADIPIRVVTISPGLMETPMLMGMPENVKESLAQQPPFPKRFGKPDEYARLVKEIVTNPMINGTTIRFDGAMRMQAR